MPPDQPGWFRPLAALTALAASGVLLCGCGSSGGSQASAAAVKNTCQAVSAALSDGPDPGADPVGYAEAQIKPLRAIHAPDQSLQAAVDGLSSAYQQFFSSNGAGPAKQAVSQASNRIDKICPGATS
jgi:4-hydroxyphenylpyruvate dioxygenase-like putative hemolysin